MNNTDTRTDNEWPIDVSELDRVYAGHVMGENLEAHRKAASLTQTDVAERVGVSTRAVSMWEGKETHPSPDHRDELAELLKEIEMEADQR